MKRLLSAFILLALLLTSVYANGKRDKIDYSNPVSVQDKIYELAEDDFVHNQEEISVLASHLSIYEREITYAFLKVDSEGKGAENFFLGWGAGSYDMGDTTGGSILSFGDTISIAAIITPAVSLAIESVKQGKLTVTEDWKKNWMYPFAITGVSLGLFFRIVSIFRPSAFEKNRNREIREVLGLEPEPSLVFVPHIDPFDRKAGFTLCLSF